MLERRCCLLLTADKLDFKLLPAVHAAQLGDGVGSLLLASGVLEAPIALCRLRELSLEPNLDWGED